MSRIALALAADTTAATRQASSLRVSHPGDAHEVEADRVADTVSRGGRVSGWSLSSAGFDAIQRDPAPSPTAPSVGAIAGKLGEALLATPEGKKALATVTAVITTPAGLTVTGATAVGVVTAMAKAGKPLPANPPEIPLDFITPGLSVKLAWNGPTNKPTDGSITLSFKPKNPEAKPATTSDKLAAETAKIKADQAVFAPKPRPTVGPLADQPKSADDLMVERYNQSKLAAIGGFARPLPSVPAPAAAAPAVQQPDPTPAPAPSPEAKKEDIPVQRKAESSAPILTGSADVDSVLRSSGRPLDRATRRDMETRIGFDFSRVRIHTDDRAAESAKSLSAHAYTVGSNVVFAPGRFSPQTTEGRHLLAHELTHVVQQNTSPAKAHPVVRPMPSYRSNEVQRKFHLSDIPGSGWVIDKIKGMKAYPLICTLLGYDVFTDEPRERNMTTITHGVLGLVDGGEELFQKLVKAEKAVQAAWDWLQGELDTRGLTVAGIEKVLTRAEDTISGWHLIESADRVIDIISEPMNQAIDLAGVIAKKVMNFVLQALLEAVGDKGKEIFDFFAQAGQVIGAIAADPLAFATNLFKAVKDGLEGFGTRILEHLGEGLKEWIFQELNISGVEMPADFSFGSMFKLIMQVLGLTYPQVRPQLVEALQDMGGETVVYFFEQSATLIADVVKAGPKQGLAIIKDKIVAEAGEIFKSMVDGIRSWVVETITKEGLKMIVKLANPVGELVAAIEGIYKLITFVIDKAAQLKQLGKTIVNALSDIVKGNTDPAAKKVEDTLANSIPVLLHFLAVELGLGDMGAKIRKIIDDIRAPIKKVIGKVLKAIADQGKKLWEAGKEAFMKRLEAIKQWWTKPRKFDWGEDEHELHLTGKGDKPEVMVHSYDPKPLDAFLDEVKATTLQRQKIHGIAQQLKWKEGEVEKPADDAKGAALFDQLREEMAKLKVKDPPTATPEYGPAPNPTYGGALTASTFISPRHSDGSPASAHDEDPPIWNDLGSLRDQKKLYFVRGHLVHSAFGGEGKWKNLMPITNGANQRMYHAVEKYLKKASEKGKARRFYHYSVTAEYKSVPLPADDPALTPQKNTEAREAAALSRLVNLRWTTTSAEADKTAPSGFKKTSEALLDETGAAMPGSVASGFEDPKVVK